MLEWGLGFLNGLFTFARDPAGAVAGWTFDRVAEGIYEWLARGLALLIEWVWGVLDAGTTPRLTEDWFANELAARIGALALAMTIAMMLASAIQAALAGRPEQALDAVKEAARSIVATAVVVTVVDHAVGIVDEASAAVWAVGRDDLVSMIEGMVGVTTQTEPLGRTFIGPLCLLFGFLGLLGLTVALLMRAALIYLVAAFAPLVFSASVLPTMRDSSRRVVHLLVALVGSKLAIVISLVVAVQLAANAGTTGTGQADMDAAAAVGTLVTGFACFLVAAFSPMVVYRLMPTVEGAVTSAGVVGGWGRSMLSLGQAALMVKGFGAAAAATRAVAGQSGVAGHAVAGGVSGETGRAPAVTGLAAATRAASGRPDATAATTDRQADPPSDGNLPAMPPAEPRAPAPWAPPGAAADDTGTEPPRYPTGPARSPADPGGDTSATKGGLPPLPARRPSPWVPPGTPSDHRANHAGGGAER